VSAAIVTGASSGIGREFARMLAEHGYDLVLVARREDRLRELSRELGARHGTKVVCVPLDLGDPGAPKQLFDAVELDVEVIVNNAGLSPDARFLDIPWEEQLAAVQVMSLAPLEITHRFLPGLLERGRGHVINVSSVGAWYPSTPTQTLYGATKAFTLRFTQTLADEYPDSGVSFTAVCPGVTRTEFLDKPVNVRAIKGIPDRFIDPPRKVADLGWKAAQSGRTFVVTGATGRMGYWLLRVLPEPMGRRMIAKQLLAAAEPTTL
jgi:short-subunit dehydrogenase